MTHLVATVHRNRFSEIAKRARRLRLRPFGPIELESISEDAAPGDSCACRTMDQNCASLVEGCNSTPSGNRSSCMSWVRVRHLSRAPVGVAQRLPHDWVRWLWDVPDAEACSAQEPGIKSKGLSQDLASSRIFKLLFVKEGNMDRKTKGNVRFAALSIFVILVISPARAQQVTFN